MASSLSSNESRASVESFPRKRRELVDARKISRSVRAKGKILWLTYARTFLSNLSSFSVGFGLSLSKQCRRSAIAALSFETSMSASKCGDSIFSTLCLSFSVTSTWIILPTNKMRAIWCKSCICTFSDDSKDEKTAPERVVKSQARRGKYRKPVASAGLKGRSFLFVTSDGTIDPHPVFNLSQSGTFRTLKGGGGSADSTSLPASTTHGLALTAQICADTARASWRRESDSSFDT
mmetsp:Transcript_28333/g.42036  ORF Transcript_28333/g.42036 Transcript_28333/m.42036 type:complete len:235 (-) Transcript_28333:1117-1821(-)